MALLSCFPFRKIKYAFRSRSGLLSDTLPYDERLHSPQTEQIQASETAAKGSLEADPALRFFFYFELRFSCAEAGGIFKAEYAA